MRHRTIIEAGASKRQPAGYRFATTNYEHFQIIYVCRGELYYEGETQDRPIGPGGLILLRKTSRFVLTTPRIGYQGVCFCAYHDLPAAFIGESEALRATSEIRTLAQLMEEHIANPLSDSIAVLQGLGRAMAWEAIRLSEADRRNVLAGRTGREWAQAARAALDATLYANVGAREVLENLPMSYRQLSRHFSETFGQSPKQYQLAAKLAEAGRMLADTLLSITTIAMELGFASSQHFATQFKAHTSQSPSDFRTRPK